MTLRAGAPRRRRDAAPGAWPGRCEPRARPEAVERFSAAPEDGGAEVPSLPDSSSNPPSARRRRERPPARARVEPSNRPPSRCVAGCARGGRTRSGDLRLPITTHDHPCPKGPSRRRAGPLGRRRRDGRLGRRGRRRLRGARWRREVAEAGVEVNLDGDREELVERARCVVKSPGVPRESPAVGARSPRGPVIGELELAWRMLPNRFVAVTGTNGKTTVAELLGHVWQGRRAGGRRGQRRHAARLAGRRPGPGRHRGLRGVQLPARGLHRLRARVRAPAERHPRPPRPPPHASTTTSTPKLRIFANQTSWTTCDRRRAPIPSIAGLDCPGRRP